MTGAAAAVAPRTREALARPLRELGEWVAHVAWDDLPRDVRDRLGLTLFDHLGVTLAGAATPEVRALWAAHRPSPGPARLLGAGRDVALDEAIWLNGIAVCCLELDEGNKFARGHPAAHAFPAALALAQAHRVSGRELCAALVAGHEVAARFGRATRLRAGVHPHGNWGAAGAAAATARLLGLDGDGVAGAIDAAGGLALATPFASALRGSFVRNAWIGAANLHGLQSARMAAAGLATPDGTAGDSLGSILGELDPGALTEELGERFDLTRGYFKRHASCSYTHPPADAALALRRQVPGLDPSQVRAVTVETHGLAAPLDGTETPTRLAAMFSVPHVTAVALAFGDCAPVRFDERHRTDPAVRALVARTRVRRDEAMDARLPGERPARVSVLLDDGRTLTAEVPNPVGDADHHPFGHAELAAKLAALLAPQAVDADRLWQLAAALPDAPDAAAVLRELP